jgi:alkanesulfonate monooxygenase SsuD/methylene tetrahydromethanopterin reductase-like flavin-dependent oxidoreductase (luciferase family)
MQVWIRQGMAYRPTPNMPFPVPGWMWDRQFGQQLYDDRLRFMRRMDELGFDGLVFTEHHYGPNGGLTPSPNIMIAAAATVTDRIKLITMGVILALHAHPVRVAEEMAMLDNLSHGRLVAGFITGNEEALYSYSVSVSEGRARHAEAYDLLRKAWTEEQPFAWHGEHFQYDTVSILPRPVQIPHPPVWTAAASEASVRWAAEHQVSLVAGGSFSQTHDALNYYQSCAATVGWTPTPQQRGTTRELYLGRTQAQVREWAERSLLRPREAPTAEIEDPRLAQIAREKWDPKAFSYWTGPFENPREALRGGGDFEDLTRRGVFLLGDPDHVTAEILRQRQEYDADVLVIRAELGALTLAEVTEELELFAREVLPVVQKA